MMKRLLVFLLLPLLIFGCSGEEKLERKWRVIDEQIYEPNIEYSKIFDSLDELEKLIYAPLSYFQNKYKTKSFIQDFEYITNSVVEEEKRELKLSETVGYSSDKDGSFKLTYKNNKNEGWDMVWKDNFLYRRQFGGEYTKTFSMGEHRYLRELLFSEIPDIYTVLREHAQIASSKAKTIDGVDGHLVVVSFNDKKSDRKELEEKSYLQNFQGTQEMKDDTLLTELAKKEKTGIEGKFKIFLDNDHVPVKMDLNVSFKLKKEGVDFRITGNRKLSKKAVDKVVVPAYNEEYHRRTLDAAANIMKGIKNDKK